jgi:hypothetical protein
LEGLKGFEEFEGLKKFEEFEGLKGFEGLKKIKEFEEFEGFEGMDGVGRKTRDCNPFNNNNIFNPSNQSILSAEADKQFFNPSIFNKVRNIN